MRLHTGAAWTPYESQHWKLTGRKILVSQTSISWILNQLSYIPVTKYTQNLTFTWRSYLTHVACHVYSYQYSYMGAHVLLVPAGSPSHSGDVAVYVFFYINQQSLPTPFYSVLASISVFMALSTVFHSINSPNNSPLSHSVLIFALLVLSTIHLFMKISFSPDIILVVNWA